MIRVHLLELGFPEIRKIGPNQGYQHDQWTKTNRTMVSYCIYITCAGFLNFAGAIASTQADANRLKFRTKKMKIFARVSDSQEANSFKNVLFQYYNTKCS